MPAFFLNAAAQLGGSVQQRVYLDESGTLGYSGELFTMAMVLVRDLPKLEACTLKNRVTQSEIKASQMKTAQKLALARTLLEQNDIDVYLVKLDPLAAMMCERKLDKEFLYDSMVAQALAFYLERGDMPPGLPYRVSMDIRGGLRESYEDMVGESVANVLMHRDVPLVTSLDVRFLDSKYSAGVQAADLFSNIYRTALTQTDSPCLSFLHKFEEAGRVHAGFTFGLPQLADQMDQIASDLRARVELEAQLAAQQAATAQADTAADKTGEPQDPNASEPAGETRGRRSRRSRGGRGRGGAAAQAGVEAQQDAAAASEQTERDGGATVQPGTVLPAAKTPGQPDSSNASLQAGGEAAVSEQDVADKGSEQAINVDTAAQASAEAPGHPGTNGAAAQAVAEPAQGAAAPAGDKQSEDAADKPARTARRRTHKKAGQVLLDAAESAAEQGAAGVEGTKTPGEMTDSSAEDDESSTAAVAVLPFAPAGMGVSRSARRRRARAARREKEAAEAQAAEAAPQGEPDVQLSLSPLHAVEDRGVGGDDELAKVEPESAVSGKAEAAAAQAQAVATAKAEPARAQAEEGDGGKVAAASASVKDGGKKAGASKAAGSKKVAKTAEHAQGEATPDETAGISNDATETPVEAERETEVQADVKPARSRRSSTRKRSSKKAEQGAEATSGDVQAPATADAAGNDIDKPAIKTAPKAETAAMASDEAVAEPQAEAKPDVKPGRAARSRAAESRMRRSKAAEKAAEAAPQVEGMPEPSAQIEPSANKTQETAEAPKAKAKRTRTRKPTTKKATAGEPAPNDAE